MIERYTPTLDSQSLKQTFKTLEEVTDFDPTYNASPSQLLPITTAKEPDKTALMQWGFISILSNNKKMSAKLFNTDIQQIHTKPSLRKSLAKNRCVIYADGFYVWKQVAKKTASPYYIHPSSKLPFCIGGYWEEQDEYVESSQDSFMLFTAPATQTVSDYQEDMPFIIPEDKLETWLSPELEIESVTDWISESDPFSLSIHAVSPAINNPSINDARLIQPSNPTDQHGNYTLFG